MSKKSRKLRLGVLVSGNGSNLQAILDAASMGKLQAEVKVVISNKKEAYALERAARSGIPGIWIDPARYPEREAYDAEIQKILEEYQVEIIVLAGYMRILSAAFVRHFCGRIINIHPALLPSFPGMHAAAQAISHGVKVTGCTVHFVDEGVDTGPIILQKAVPVREGDTVESLTARIQKEEHKLYPRAINLLAAGKVKYQEGKCDGKD